MAVTLQDIITEISTQATLIGSVQTLVAGLKQQLADALAGTTLPPAVQAQVDAIFAAAEANNAALTQAVTANTPAAATPVSAEGTSTVVTPPPVVITPAP